MAWPTFPYESLLLGEQDLIFVPNWLEDIDNFCVTIYRSYVCDA